LLREGESKRADRSQKIGKLEVAADDIERDLPAGSEVEITVEIDQNRIVTVKAFVPILDEEFEKVIDYEGYKQGLLGEAALREAFEEERKRLAELRAKVDEAPDPAASEALQRIYSERLIKEVEEPLAAADYDEDAANRCDSRLRELRMALDRVEDALEWPMLVKKAETEIAEDRQIVNDGDFDATAEEKARLDRLVESTRRAIAAHDSDGLQNLIKEMDLIATRIVLRHPGWWVGQVRRLDDKKQIMSDQGLADRLLNEARASIDRGDVDGLQNSVRQLWRLLPVDDPDRNRDKGTIYK